MNKLLLAFGSVTLYSAYIAAQRMIGLAPFEKFGEFPTEEIRPKTEEERSQRLLLMNEINAITDGNSYQAQIDRLHYIIRSNDSSFTNYGKMLAYLMITDIYINQIQKTDSCLFTCHLDYANEEYVEYPLCDAHKENNRKFAQKMTKGMHIINSLIDSAMFFASEERAPYFSKIRVFYMENTGYREMANYEFSKPNDYQFDGNENYEDFEPQLYFLDELNSQIEQMTDTKEAYQAKIELQRMQMAYSETHYNPYFGYNAVGLGVTGMIGKEVWIGGELSVGYSSDKNWFRSANPLTNEVTTGLNVIKVNYQQSLSSSKKDFSFSLLNVSKFTFFSFDLLQFGWQTGPDFGDKFRWFYRPEFGLTFGMFAIKYGYNLMFNKSIRGFTEKNMLTFKISYPLFRYGDYQ